MKNNLAESNIFSFSVKTKVNCVNYQDFELAYTIFKTLKKLKLEPLLIANYKDSTSLQVF